MNRSIIIIGAGMGGLAAGVYAQMNGYQTGRGCRLARRGAQKIRKDVNFFGAPLSIA